jgi:hypothetical protein
LIVRCFRSIDSDTTRIFNPGWDFSILHVVSDVQIKMSSSIR